MELENPITVNNVDGEVFAQLPDGRVVPYDQMVAKLAKPGLAILESLNAMKCDLWHMSSCIPGEAGELFDAIKKFVIYEKPLDLSNVIEELGDLEFYMQGVRAALGISREETLMHNMKKLNKRYPGYGYTNANAQARADKTLPIVRLTSEEQPIYYAEKEGGEWQKWPAALHLPRVFTMWRDSESVRYQTGGKLILTMHALRFANGAEWDCRNGWRLVAIQPGVPGCTCFDSNGYCEIHG